MKQFLQQVWREDEGVLSIDWVILVTVVVIGIVSGLAAVRDAMIDEFGDAAEATLNIDQSYTFAGVPGLVPDSIYNDVQLSYSDCGRTGP